MQLDMIDGYVPTKKKSGNSKQEELAVLSLWTTTLGQLSPPGNSSGDSVGGGSTIGGITGSTDNLTCLTCNRWFVSLKALYLHCSQVGHDYPLDKQMEKSQSSPVSIAQGYSPGYGFVNKSTDRIRNSYQTKEPMDPSKQKLQEIKEINGKQLGTQPNIFPLCFNVSNFKYTGWYPHPFAGKLTAVYAEPNKCAILQFRTGRIKLVPAEYRLSIADSRYKKAHISKRWITVGMGVCSSPQAFEQVKYIGEDFTEMHQLHNGLQMRTESGYIATLWCEFTTLDSPHLRFEFEPVTVKAEICRSCELPAPSSCLDHCCRACCGFDLCPCHSVKNVFPDLSV
jgi:hypothetical protein